MMRYCGYSEYFHDAGLAFVTEDGEIDFASHAERFSRKKNDSVMPASMWELLQKDDHITFYEDHSLRRERFIDKDGNLLPAERIPVQHQFVMTDSLDYDDFIPHHVSHAAIGYYTRPWESTEDTVILTIDGVGEWQSMGIFDHNLKELERWDTPLSLGILYTQVTKVLGLRSLEDEYVTMGMAAYGDPVFGEDFVEFFENLKAMKEAKPWAVETKPLKDFVRRAARVRINPKTRKPGCSDPDLAASVQYFAEKVLMDLAKKCSKYGKKLVVSGGCAQNIVAMSMIKESGLFEDMWIAVAPTDAGSALGAAAYQYCKQTGENKIKWKDAYLGTDMGCTINPKEVVNHLLEHEYCGIASGRAEYGPRALGNRSLIADVRRDVKDTVNRIKRRQEYRPFAPAILEEFASEYFEGPMNEYMQYQSIAKHDYKSVTHVDGTARVQVVKKDCTSIFRKIIEEYYERTGVPMLLNTSLNIRGMPMVDKHKDAKQFSDLYNVPVFT